MKNRIIALLLAGALLGLAGCQSTPDSPVIEKKGGAEKYAPASDEENEAELVSGALKEKLELPENYSADFEDSTGSIRVKAEKAAFTLPNADKLTVRSVRNREFSAADIERFADVMLGDATYYEREKFLINRPKSEYEEQLLKLRQWKAEGNLDPYDDGINEETGEPIYDLDAAIEYTEQQYAGAAEVPDWEEVPRAPGENYSYLYTLSDEEDDEKALEKHNNKYFSMGASVLENGRNYSFASGTWHSDETGEYPVFSQYRSFLTLKNSTLNLANSYYDPSIQGFEMSADATDLTITEQEAEAMGNQLVAELGFEHLTLDHIEYYSNYSYESGPNYRKAVYGLLYVPTSDGVPYTFTRQKGDSLESVDTYEEPWAYERLEIIMDSEGILEFFYINPEEEEAVVNSNVEMLPFEQIRDIFEQMILIQNAHIPEQNSTCELEITDIKLGYMRVLDPENRDTGLVIPVWDFFGKETVTYAPDDYEAEDPADLVSERIDPYQSYLTINAVDGTIIDRSIGY